MVEEAVTAALNATKSSFFELTKHLQEIIASTMQGMLAKDAATQHAEFGLRLSSPELPHRRHIPSLIPADEREPEDQLIENEVIVQKTAKKKKVQAKKRHAAKLVKEDAKLQRKLVKEEAKLQRKLEKEQGISAAAAPSSSANSIFAIKPKRPRVTRPSSEERDDYDEFALSDNNFDGQELQPPNQKSKISAGAVKQKKMAENRKTLQAMGYASLEDEDEVRTVKIEACCVA